MLNKKTKKKVAVCLGIFGVVAIALFIFLKFSSRNNPISRHPSAISYHRGKLNEIPQYDEDVIGKEGSQIDLRSTDISKLNLNNEKEALMHADFDSKTIWPSSLPDGFDPETIMDYGKDPGLNIRKLHEENITGEGVGIAIVDQTLLTDHDEYKKNLKLYKEINKVPKKAQMHGAAVSSIAVGKNVGVAPGADLYYVAAQPFTIDSNNNSVADYKPIAQAIDYILKINDTLPEDKKIRVISLSIGWNDDENGAEELNGALKRAMEQNIFVVSSDFSKFYSVNIKGLGREGISNPNSVNSYTVNTFSKGDYYSKYEEDEINNTIRVPIDSRCTASPTGTKDYVFYSQGGMSWAIPYIAGLYVLSCQVKQDITPKIFLKEAISTGSVININKDQKNYKLGKIINPEKLIEKLKQRT